VYDIGKIRQLDSGKIRKARLARSALTFAVSVAVKGSLSYDMDFPATWVVLQLDQFDTALPDIKRSSGRALDHFRFSLNGSLPLEATVGLENIIPVQDFVGWEHHLSDVGPRHPPATQHDDFCLVQHHGHCGEERLRRHRPRRGWHPGGGVHEEGGRPPQQRAGQRLH
jgi:hypothetical protein